MSTIAAIRWESQERPRHQGYYAFFDDRDNLPLFDGLSLVGIELDVLVNPRPDLLADIEDKEEFAAVDEVMNEAAVDATVETDRTLTVSDSSSSCMLVSPGGNLIDVDDLCS